MIIARVDVRVAHCVATARRLRRACRATELMVRRALRCAADDARAISHGRTFPTRPYGHSTYYGTLTTLYSMAKCPLRHVRTTRDFPNR